jgi:antitoxin ParD1/3/4
MRKLNVSLSDEFVDFVESEVASGEYVSASEIVRDGLRLLQREKAAYHEKIRILRREVGIGVARRRVPAVCRHDGLPKSSPSWTPRMSIRL